LTGPARKEDDDGHDQLRLDRLQKAGLLEKLRVGHRAGDHPRVAEGEYGIRKDPVLRPFDGDDVGQPEETAFGSGVMGFEGLAEQSRRRRDEDESTIAL